MTEQIEPYGDDLKKYEDRHPATIPSNEVNLLELLIKKDANLETIEKFMDLKDRDERNEARKAYVVAMTEFKKDPPEISKQTHVEYEKKDGTITSYNHASLDHITEQINISLSEHGLFASWSQTQSDKEITVTCRITHIMGHYEETSLTAGADLSGNKNAIQGLGSTITYLQRYTILALTGLAAKGMDNDGNLPDEESEPINQDQINEIEDLKKEAKIDEIDFVNRLQKKFGVAAVDRLNTADADELITALNIVLKKNANNN